MSDFSYKDIDEVGLETLAVIENANQFNNWMYDTIKPYLKGRVIEIGSGTGNISLFVLRDNFEVTLTDIRENYRTILKAKFKDFNNLSKVTDIDIASPNFDDDYKDYVGQFDSLFCLNVIEHIKDDTLAMQNCSKLLKSDGHLIILVPAYQALYNEFDRQLEHYRRYRLSSLVRIFPSQLWVIHKQHFNFVGIFGWFISGKILGKKSIPSGQMKLYDKLVSLFRIIDASLLHKIGLSVIVVGRKMNGT
jgi:SAM-dependent methyltransferase